MQSQEFNKLFTEENQKAMVAKLSEMRLFSDKTRKEKREAIQEKQEVIAPEFNERIQAFIKQKKSEGKHINQIKSMVKKQFGITVI